VSSKPLSATAQITGQPANTPQVINASNSSDSSISSKGVAVDAVSDPAPSSEYQAATGAVGGQGESAVDPKSNEYGGSISETEAGTSTPIPDDNAGPAYASRESSRNGDLVGPVAPGSNSSMPSTTQASEVSAKIGDYASTVAPGSNSPVQSEYQQADTYSSDYQYSEPADKADATKETEYSTGSNQPHETPPKPSQVKVVTVNAENHEITERSAARVIRSEGTVATVPQPRAVASSPSVQQNKQETARVAVQTAKQERQMEFLKCAVTSFLSMMEQNANMSWEVGEAFAHLSLSDSTDSGGEQGILVAGILPIDLAGLQRDAERFFSRLDAFSEEMMAAPVQATLVRWLAAALVTTCIFELARWPTKRRNTFGIHSSNGDWEPRSVGPGGWAGPRPEYQA
jgi:hypothetical protein